MNGLLGRKPVTFGRRQAPPAGPQLPPLAARVLDHYRHTQMGFMDSNREARAFTEDLLQEADPADLVASLVIGFPAVVAGLLKDEGASRLIDGYRAVLHHGVSRLETIPLSHWRLPNDRIGAALNAYLPVILVEPHGALQSRIFLAGLLKRAADGPAERAALIAFIDAALQGQKLGASQVRKFIEQALPGLGIGREEIPVLARWAAQGRDVQLRRNRLEAGAGPLLGPVLDHLLDGASDLYRSRSDQCSALQTLFAADATERGKAFAHLLDLIVTAGGLRQSPALGAL